MCRVSDVHRSGFYHWLNHPLSSREKEDRRLLGKTITFWKDSDMTYGSPRIFKDLRESGEQCGENRVAKIMRQNKIKAILGIRKHRYHYGSDDWVRFCKDHNLIPSMSRRGNCWDNAVAESFFGSLKKERIRKRTYRNRDVL
jgi:hypothetical protein